MIQCLEFGQKPYISCPVKQLLAIQLTGGAINPMSPSTLTSCLRDPKSCGSGVPANVDCSETRPCQRCFTLFPSQVDPFPQTEYVKYPLKNGKLLCKKDGLFVGGSVSFMN